MTDLPDDPEPPRAAFAELGMAQPGHPWYEAIRIGTEYANQLLADEPDVSDNSLLLIRKKLAMAVRFDSGLIDAAVEYGAMFDEYLMRFKATIYGEELPPHTVTRTAYVPDGWWQHFRKDHTDRWWMSRSVRRKPIRTRTITLTATWENMAAYPWMSLRTQNTPEYLGAAVRLTLPPTSTITGTDDGDDD